MQKTKTKTKTYDEIKREMSGYVTLNWVHIYYMRLDSYHRLRNELDWAYYKGCDAHIYVGQYYLYIYTVDSNGDLKAEYELNRGPYQDLFDDINEYIKENQKYDEYDVDYGDEVLLAKVEDLPESMQRFI